MEDFLLDVEGMVNAHIRQSDKAKTRVIFSNLLKFAYDKGMLVNSPFDESGNLMAGIVIRESGLTESGKLYFDTLTDKWLVYTDKDDSKIERLNNIKMLEKYYDRLKRDYEKNNS